MAYRADALAAADQTAPRFAVWTNLDKRQRPALDVRDDFLPEPAPLVAGGQKHMDEGQCGGGFIE